MTVVDASVYVALLNAHEPAHAACWVWLEDAQERDEELVAPAVLAPEVAAALARGVGDPALAHRAVAQLLASAVIELVPVTVDLARRAAEVAADLKVRGCDALYVALAERLATPLVSLDEQQLARGAARIRVLRPGAVH